MLYLYHHNSSVCAAKIRIAFAEKALTWEGEMIDLNAGDQFKPDYVKLNPKSVVPTLIHDGHVVIESNIILEYLEDAFPNPSLRPSAATDRAQMRLWLQRLDNGATVAMPARDSSCDLGDQLRRFLSLSIDGSVWHQSR